MTTICSDGRTVAADGLLCAGDEPQAHDCQKIILHVTGVIGFTGNERYRKPVIDWYYRGCNTDMMPKTPDGEEHEWALIVFDPDKVMSYNSNVPYPQNYPYPFAIGSGDTYALGALHAGASPEAAVRIASALNVHTGGTVTVLSIGSEQAREAAE